MGTIDDILSDEPADETVATEAATPTPERDESGRFKAAETGETEPATPEPQQVPPTAETIPIAAQQDERRKRQEAERRAEELAARLAQLEAAQPAPSIWEDEQGWQQNFGQTVVSQAVAAASENARFDMSEMLARQANPDFDEMKEAFLELARENPVLADQAKRDPHPWHKAYTIAKSHKSMQELGATDVASLEAKIREKVMAELAQEARPASGLPPTLSNVGSVGQRTGPAWSGPRPMNELLA